MSNLKFLSNVTHNGVVIPAGAIVSDAERGLSAVAQNLIDRELAQLTTEVATHTAHLVGPDQMAILKPQADSGEGSAPQAQAQIEKDAKARSEGQQPAPASAPQPQAQTQVPSAEQIAAEAAAVK